MVTLEQKTAKAGNSGPRIRSDCEVSIELRTSGGILINTTSKVKALYDTSNRLLINKILEHRSIQHATVNLEDSGALPFVIAARLEAALNAFSDSKPAYIIQGGIDRKPATARDKRRFSRLYLPGNTPSLMINAGLHKPDGIILDLEDSVAPEKKEEARILVRNAIHAIDFYESEVMVRINQLPLGLTDLEYVVPHGVHLILLPKCESAEDVLLVDQHIKRILSIHKLDAPIWILPIIESALGVVNAFEIATATDTVVALAIGLEDYTADLGTLRTQEGWESFYARSVIVNACKAAKIQAIDSVYSDVGDMDGLRETVIRSKAMGFDGMGCIHPRQIPVIHESFAPEPEELLKAQKIVLAFEQAKQKGLGVVSLGTKMIDPPVVKRAEKVVALAVELGLLNTDWRNENEG